MPLLFKIDRPLVAMDLETTGRTPNDRIVQIAIKRFEPGIDYSVETPKEYWTLVNPGIPIPNEATYGNGGAYPGHGIADEHVLGKPRWEDVAAGCFRAFTDADIAGYNVKFDMTIFKNECARVGVSTELPAGARPPRVIDALRLWQLLHPRTLSDACVEFLGREHKGAHDANADVDETLDILGAQLARPAFAGKSFDDLHALQFPVDPNAVTVDGKLLWLGTEVIVNFGEHAGKPLRSVPAKYLQWIVGPKCQQISADVKRMCADALNGVYPVRA